MEDELCKTAHKVFKLKYHFVFCIKYRKDFFAEQIYQDKLKEICEGIQERYHIKFETLGFDKTHVHFMLQSIPNYSASKIFQIVKSITAIKLFENFPNLKKELWGGEFWSDRGFVGSVGEGINAEIIRKYIQNQGKKAEQLKLVDFV